MAGIIDWIKDTREPDLKTTVCEHFDAEWAQNGAAFMRKISALAEEWQAGPKYMRVRHGSPVHRAMCPRARRLKKLRGWRKKRAQAEFEARLRMPRGLVHPKDRMAETHPPTWHDPLAHCTDCGKRFMEGDDVADISDLETGEHKARLCRPCMLGMTKEQLDSIMQPTPKEPTA